MSNPTQNTPWRTEASPHGGTRVLDSTGALVHFVSGGGDGEQSLAEAKAVAEMMAAGSEVAAMWEQNWRLEFAARQAVLMGYSYRDDDRTDEWFTEQLARIQSVINQTALPHPELKAVVAERDRLRIENERARKYILDYDIDYEAVVIRGEKCAMDIAIEEATQLRQRVTDLEGAAADVLASHANHVRFMRSGQSPYIRENGRYEEERRSSPWGELCDDVIRLAALLPAAPQSLPTCADYRAFLADPQSVPDPDRRVALFRHAACCGACMELVLTKLGGAS